MSDDMTAVVIYRCGMNTPRPDPDAVQWMTYAELARRLGIDVNSAKRRAYRNGWRTQEPNDPRDRTVRVAVPLDILPPETSADASADGRASLDTSADGMASADASAVTPGVAALAALLDRTIAELGQARAELAQERARRVEVETRLGILLAEEKFLSRGGLAARLRRVAELRYAK